ncbi:MAG: hypothetical protein ABIJ84_04670, partial [bacterium]
AYKIYMTSDGSDTPVLDSITFNYTAYDASRGVEISYPASGSLISTNLFDGVGSVASVDSFDYIVSAMPAGTGVVIQFSQDQTNWYGSDGILDNSDTLSAGSNNIGLSGLEWSGANFYYKLTFTSDESNTSVLTSIAVNYTDDATAPTTTPTATAGGASYTFDTWTNKTSLSVLLTCADNAGGVGCATTYYCQDTANTCTPTTTYSSAVAVSTEGTSYIRYYSTDTVPNSETTASQIIKIDTTAPVTAFSSTRSTNNITATLTCADSGSSCSVTYYCTDLTNECTPTTAYTSAVSLSISQNTYFRYYSIDFVLNSASVTSQRIDLMGGSGGAGSGSDITTPWSQTQTPAASEQPPSVPEQIVKTTTETISQAVEQASNLAKQATDFALKIGKKASEIAEIFKFKKVAVVPEKPQFSLQGIDLISVDPLSRFSLVPIDSTIAFLAGKIPQLRETLDALAIDTSKSDDVKKLVGNELFLPEMTKTILTQAEIEDINQFEFSGVPLAELSVDALAKMPSDIVFARTAGELIDIRTVIAVDSQGNAEQKIRTFPGRQIQLVINPEVPAKRVSGLITLTRLAIERKPDNGFIKLFSAALSLPKFLAKTEESQPSSVLVDKFEYSQVKPGIFQAEITAPISEGEYKIVTVIEYKDESLLPAKTELLVVVDPEGYVYRETPDGILRIKGAEVSLYWLNPETKEYELWPAKKFLQKNPIITDETGKFSFIVPEGMYYLSVKAPNHSSYQGDPFSVVEDKNVRIHIELKKQTSWLDWLNWQTAIVSLLLVIIALLGGMTWFFIRNRQVKS